MSMLADSVLRLCDQAKSTICETSSYKPKHKVIYFFFCLIPIQSVILLQLITDISCCTVCQYTFVCSGRFVCSACRFVLNAFIQRILFHSDVYFKPSLFTIQSAAQWWRFTNKNKTNCRQNEFAFEVESNCGNEIERKGWGNPLEDKNMYDLKKKCIR